MRGRGEESRGARRTGGREGTVRAAAALLTLALLAGALVTAERARAAGLGSLGSPITDVGVDTNGDKLYNYLRIDATLAIATPGTFTVKVVLNDDLDLAMLTQASVTAALAAGTQTATVLLDGADIYNGGVDGPYYAHLSLVNEVGTVLSTAVHTTAAYGFLNFQPYDARLVPPSSERTIDNDSDGLVDWIDLGFTVQVATAESYRLYSQLTDPTYTAEDTWTQVRTLAPGKYTLDQLFLGYPLRLAARSGPYLVTNSLYDARGTLIDFAYVQTAAYNYTAFETVPGWLVPPFSDAGIDTDGDGLYNTLRVSVGLGFEYAGNYTLVGRLLTESGSLIQQAAVPLAVAAGPRVAALDFAGSKIYASGVDGPYTVDVQLYDSALRKLDERTSSTGAYGYKSFQPQLLFFDPPHQDAGLDPDNDGKLDFLRLTVGVYFNLAGTATITAGLRAGASAPNFTKASVTVTLSAGYHQVYVDIPGSQIVASGVSGTWYAWLTAYDLRGNLVDQAQYRGGTYSVSSFEADGGGHILGLTGSQGQDTDGDGLYNRLWLGVLVNVTAAGRYRVDGVLSSGRAILTTSATTVALVAGNRTVGLLFSGRDIRATGLDGPFNATLTLGLAGQSGTFDSRVLATPAFTAASFQSESAAALSGRVTLASTGQPLANATVWLLDYANQVSRLATTDALGNYAVGAYAGSYWAIVDHPDGQATATQITLSGATTYSVALAVARRNIALDVLAWTSWRSVVVSVRYMYVADAPAIRFWLDWWGGNRDGWVDAGESATLPAFDDLMRDAIGSGSTDPVLTLSGIPYAASGPAETVDYVAGTVSSLSTPMRIVSRAFLSGWNVSTPSRAYLQLQTYYDNLTVDHQTILDIPGGYRLGLLNASSDVVVYAKRTPYVLDPTVPWPMPAGEPMGNATFTLLRSISYVPPTPGAPTGLNASAAGGPVSLTWVAPLRNTDDSRTVAVAGYWVYRATSSSGPFVRVNALLRTWEGFTDSPGAGTFYYAVSAVNTDGVEGVMSSPMAVRVASSALTAPAATAGTAPTASAPAGSAAPLEAMEAAALLPGILPIVVAVLSVLVWAVLRRRRRPGASADREAPQDRAQNQ